MKIVKQTFLWKVTAFFRFLIIKAFYPKVFHNCRRGVIGPRCIIALKRKNGIAAVGDRLIMIGDAEISAKGDLQIGRGFCINNYSRVVSFNRIVIGNNVTLARFVSILDHNHKGEMYNNELKFDGYETGVIEIGDNVWVGDKVTILRNVKIGSNVIIGANAVVTADIPPNCIVGGIPARILKTLQKANDI